MIKQLAFLLLFLSYSIYAQEPQKVVSPEQQRYLTELKALDRKITSQFYPNYSRIYAMSDKAFVSKIDSARNDFDAALNKYQSKLDPDYVSDQRAEIKYYFDKILIEYPRTNEIYSGKPFNVSPKIIERLKVNLVDFNKPELLSNSDFINYFNAFLSLQTYLELRKGAYKNQDNQHFQTQWKLIPKYISNRKCREYWQYTYLYDHIDNDGIKGSKRNFTELSYQKRFSASFYFSWQLRPQCPLQDLPRNSVRI